MFRLKFRKINIFVQEITKFGHFLEQKWKRSGKVNVKGDFEIQTKISRQLARSAVESALKSWDIVLSKNEIH